MASRPYAFGGEPIGEAPDRRRALSRVAGVTPGVALGVAILLLIVLLALLVPVVSPYGVEQQDFNIILAHPSSRHLFGTDELGRDIFTRVCYGARYSLFISFLSVAGAAIVGTALGLVAGYLGGIVDDVVMRICDLQLAFPLVLLALTVIAILGGSVLNVILVFALTIWPVFARTVRGSTILLRERPFVDASRAIGASRGRILLRHVLPNALSPLVVVGTFQFASVVIYEASLGFLGLGVQPPTPTWGNMMAEGRQYISSAWWICLFPGVALVLTTAAANWLGDGLNRIIDPRQRA